MAKWTTLPFIATLLLAGCGAKEGGVSGIVSYNGKNLTHGTVVFHGANGIPVNAIIDESGKYAAKGIALGEARVTVIQLPKDYRSPSELRKEYQAAGKKIDPSLFAPPKSLIPSRYGDVEKTDLRVTVTAGAVAFDIPLSDKK